MIELFDHTADLGMRVRAATLEGLLAEAGRGLLSILVVNPEAVRPVLTRQVELEADDLSWLLFDWLSELLYAFDTEKLLLCQFEITLTDGTGRSPSATASDLVGKESLLEPADPQVAANHPPTEGPWRLVALCRGERSDPARHEMDHEVKAITYHGLRVEHTPDGWEAEVIVDI